MTAFKGTILVTGASGHLGQLVLEDLIAKHQGKIIAGSRNTDKLKTFKERGVDVRQVDFNQPAGLTEAFKGVDKLFLISTDSLAVPGERLVQHQNAVKAAKAAGVKHIVYTSINNPESLKLFFAPDHKGTEEAIQASGLTYTILRNNWYDQNLDGTIQHALQSGEVVTSTGNGKVGFITREDCARVAATVLLSNDFQNAILDVTNEASVSYPELAAIIAEAAGKQVEFKNVSKKDIEGIYTSMKLPSFVVELIATYEESVADNKLDVTNKLVRELTGRAPKSVKDYVREVVARS